MVLEHNYKNFLKGKRVIFVGPGPMLKGSGKGSWIDSFDVVIRTNNFINLLDSPEIRKDYGSKCHVLYVNRQFYRECKPFPIEDWVKKRGLEWICIKHARGKDKQEWRKNIKVREVKATISSLIRECPSVLMGSVLIYETCEAEYETFFIEGIDFNLSRPKVFVPDRYPEYVPGYLPARIVAQGNVLNSVRGTDGHDVISNTKIIHRLWKEGKFHLPEETVELMLGAIEGRYAQR